MCAVRLTVLSVLPETSTGLTTNGSGWELATSWNLELHMFGCTQVAGSLYQVMRFLEYQACVTR